MKIIRHECLTTYLVSKSVSDVAGSGFAGQKLEMPRGLRESAVLRSLSFNNKCFEVPANRSALSKPPGSNEQMDLTDNPEGEEIDVELK
jgi:hypothetical protein